MNETPTPRVDEHGNPMPCMYRLKFPGGNTEHYFYTEETYRTLERELTAALAKVAELEAGMKRVCGEISSLFLSVSTQLESALTERDAARQEVADVHTTHNQIIDANRRERDNLRQQLNDERKLREELVADKERMDWLESTPACLESPVENSRRRWSCYFRSHDGIEAWSALTAREAIDTARVTLAAVKGEEA